MLTSFVAVRVRFSSDFLDYIKDNTGNLSFLVIFCVVTHVEAFSLSSSKIVDASVFRAPLSLLDLQQLETLGLVGNICHDLPQLFMSIVFQLYIGQPTRLLALGLIMSEAQVLHGIVRRLGLDDVATRAPGQKGCSS
jgi:hypothetical protein